MKISVVGLGKLGAPLAAVLASRGHSIWGVDENERTVNALNVGRAPVDETGLQALLDKNPIYATTIYDEAIRPTDVTYVIVPTPSDDTGRFINDYVIKAVTEIGKAIANKKKHHTVCICSTTMPGAVDGPIREALEEASGRTVGDNLTLAYSPEFIALGSVIFDMLHPDLVIIGESDSVGGKKLERIARSVSDAPVRRMSITNAEIAKISVNAYVTMKISFANTLAEICEQVPTGDATVIANAIGLDTRIGRKYLTPGPATGGPCFNRDSLAFTRFAEDHQVVGSLSAATKEVNDRQTYRLAAKVLQYAGSKPVGILGVSYKPNTHITEESPSLVLANLLEQAGKKVILHDPKVPAADTGEFSRAFAPKDLFLSCDVVVIMTAWKEYAELAPRCFETNPHLVLVDCWNVVPHGPWDDLGIVRLGQHDHLSDFLSESSP